jgi:hypothetical protein
LPSDMREMAAARVSQQAGDRRAFLSAVRATLGDHHAGSASLACASGSCTYSRSLRSTKAGKPSIASVNESRCHSDGARPKSDGGVRKLGVPTALDRFVQQAVLQVLQPIFAPTFSDHSYGFRPGRSAHQAVAVAQGHLDLEKFRPSES